VLEEAIKHTDFTVLCGHRGREEQDRAFAEGRSKLRYPSSRHNKMPSRAVDVAPWPIDWQDERAFEQLAIHILAAASALGIKIRWGGLWRNFSDKPHYELI
jgi:peptidoglycan L-alanyl-D-glutamate endopeptidase CwlK